MTKARFKNGMKGAQVGWTASSETHALYNHETHKHDVICTLRTGTQRANTLFLAILHTNIGTECFTAAKMSLICIRPVTGF
jgi:hypothetical protein